MGYELLVHERAQSALRDLDADEQERIRSKLLEMVESEWRDLTDYDVTALRGTDADLYRARIGDYRVVFATDDERIGILRIEERRSAYRNLGALVERARDLLGG